MTQKKQEKQQKKEKEEDATHRECRPRLRPGVRLSYDPARQRHVVLSPETVLMPNATATAVLRLCDGTATVPQIVAALRERYQGVREQEVHALLGRLADRRLVLWS